MKRLASATGEAAGIGMQADIEDALQAYETALNASDIKAVLAAFTPDAVFMAPNSPSAIGTDAIGAAYGGIFKAIRFETELSVQEISQVAPEWAFVRTNSAGFVTVQAIEQRVPDANHELFVLQKVGEGNWKIARYSFSSTNPPPQ